VTVKMTRRQSDIMACAPCGAAARAVEHAIIKKAQKAKTTVGSETLVVTDCEGRVAWTVVLR